MIMSPEAIYSILAAVAIVDIVITVKNIGMAKVIVPADGMSKCVCHVRRVQRPPEDGVILWESLEATSVCDPIQFMGDWGACNPAEPMVFEPGSKDAFHVVFSGRRRGMLWMRAEFVDKDDNVWRADRLVDLGSRRKA